MSKGGPTLKTRRSLLLGLGALGLLLLAGPAGGPYQRAGAQGQAQRSLSAAEAEALMSKGELLLVDVRSKPEWVQTRIAEGALPITIHDPEGKAAFVEKVAAAAGGETGRPIAFICATGVRSAYAYQLLEERGFTNLYNVPEGMLGNPRHGPGWLKRGLPTERCTTC
jgi:rhodanese-related sulfurtransferase